MRKENFKTQLNRFEEYEIQPVPREKIEKYRARFKFGSNVSDEEITKLIKSMRWIAKLYIKEFMKKSPSDVLKFTNTEYNESADNLISKKTKP